MRRITMWFTATVVIVVLLFSYRTSLGAGRTPARTSDGGADAGANAPGIVSGPNANPAPSAGSAQSDGSTPGGSAPTTGSGGSGSTVANGTVSQTRWGPVQVQVTIAGGRITDVKTLQQPNGNFRDQEINSYAVPQLRQEVLSAQSANIDTVSGATVTSDGYISSLQAALDAAHFKA
jgi:FMN-binding protein